MGLLDEMVKGLAGKVLGGGGQSALLDSIFNLIKNPETGGLQGLVQNFKNKGFNDIISSWISTGENLPVTSDQIENVVGKDQILRIAKKLGFSGEEVSGGLASLLPEIIDKLTPKGTLPENEALLQRLSIFKKDLLNI
jgi:uncharacterized protein YidB (DUF937 family)